MRKASIMRYAILISISLTVTISCTYDEVLLPPPPEGVSYAEDVIPIFNTSCNTSGCHDGSAFAPDLRAASAYEALLDGGYIDTLSPESSELYEWMAGLEGLPMPPSGVNQSYAEIVLQWIREGALNN